MKRTIVMGLFLAAALVGASSGMIVSTTVLPVNGQRSALSNVESATERALEQLDEQANRHNADQMENAAGNVQKALNNAQEGIFTT
jgi:hypothetical protein